jgi:hypothetical protein
VGEVSGPDWLDNSFAAVMLAVAAYSTGRLVAARRWARPTHSDVDVAHVLMGTGMAGMLVAALNPVPAGWWELIFSALGVWFVWRCVEFVRLHGVEGRDEDHVHHLSHYVTHLVMVGAMLYMYAVATPGVGASRHAGMAMNGATGTTADFVGLPLFFVAVLLASAIWELDGIGRFSQIERGAVRPPPADAEPPVLGTTQGGEGIVTTAVATTSVAASPAREETPWLAPRLEAACHIAMCVTMSYMLVLIV